MYVGKIAECYLQLKLGKGGNHMYKKVCFQGTKGPVEYREGVVFEASYRIGATTIKDLLIVSEGGYHFEYEESHLKKLWQNNKIHENDFLTIYESIIRDASKWCKKNGLPELKIPTREEIKKN